MSERSGGRERSEQSGASEQVSGVSERANGRASGPVLQSVFLAVLDHSVILISPAFNNIDIKFNVATSTFYNLTAKKS